MLSEQCIFIRRITATIPSPTDVPSPAPLPKPPPVPPDEQFDFVPAPSDTPGSSNNAPLPDVVKPSAPIGVETLPHAAGDVVTGRAEGGAAGKTGAGKQLVGPAKTKVAVRTVVGRVRREAVRLVVESSFASQLRMPTRRETFLFTWEVSLIVGVLLLLRAGVASTLRWIHNRLNATRGLKSNIPYEASVFECMQRPLEFLSLFTVGTALADAVSRPLAASGLLKHIRTLRELGIIISATWFLLKWIDRIRSRFVMDKRIDKAQVDATSRIATVATFVASLLISLDTIGINVQTVLAFGGIGGVAIGFAGREIISNFFGGFMIYVTRPFSVGEWIRSIEESELNGTVEDIGWYLTRVRTWDKRPLYIPNSRFSTLIVENGSRMDNRRILHTLHLRHEDMPVAPVIVAAMEQLLMSHPDLDPRQHRLAYVDSFGEYSVKIWLSCYTKSVFLYDYRRVQQDILIKCYDIIRANGAKLATVNTRDVRPGLDTDRYGPLGRNASFRQATTGSQTPETASQAVTSDVPGSPRYARSNPVIRFNNIESGVDFSRVGQPVVPGSVPANATDIRQPAPVSGSIRSTENSNAVSSADSASQRTASVAAVAAAAAAIQAGLKNASSRNQGDDQNNVQAAQSQADNIDPSAVALDAQGTVPPSVTGQMKITAAKPPRTAAPPPSQNVSSAQSATAAGSKNVASNKSTEEPPVSNTKQTVQGKVEYLSSLSRPVTSTPAPAAAEMKISKAPRKAQPLGQGSTESDKQETKENEKPVSRESVPSQKDSTDIRPSTVEAQSTAAGPAPQKKISPVKPSRPTATGTVTMAPSTSETNHSTSSEVLESDGGQPGVPSGMQVQNDDNATTVKAGINRQINPSGTGALGEMKISKARKPMPVVPVSSEGEGKNASQGSGAANTAKPQPGSGPSSSSTLADDVGSET